MFWGNTSDSPLTDIFSHANFRGVTTVAFVLFVSLLDGLVRLQRGTQ